MHRLTNTYIPPPKKETLKISFLCKQKFDPNWHKLFPRNARFEHINDFFIVNFMKRKYTGLLLHT